MKRLYRVKEGIVELIGYPDNVRIDDCKCDWVTEVIIYCSTKINALEFARQYDAGQITYDNLNISDGIVSCLQ